MLSVTRRLPRAFVAPVRLYTTGRTEGSVAESKGFSKKEKAHEDQYVHNHEMAQLAKLKAKIAEQKQALGELEKEHADLEKDVKSNSK